MVQLFSPVDGSLLWEFQETSAEELELVIRRSHQSQKTWSQLSVTKRINVVQKYLQLLEKHQEELLDLIHRERGLSLKMAKKEHELAMNGVRGSEKIPSFFEENVFSLDGMISYNRYTAKGVVGVISSHLFSWQSWHTLLFPLLVMGNSVVVKASSYNPLTAKMMTELWQVAGGDSSLLQIVFSDKDDVCQSFISHSFLHSFFVFEREKTIERWSLLTQKYQKHLFALPIVQPIAIVDRDMPLELTIESLSSLVHEELGLTLIAIGKGERWPTRFYEKLKSSVVRGEWGAFNHRQERDRAKKNVEMLLKKEGRLVVDCGEIWQYQEERSAYFGPLVVDRLSSRSTYFQQERRGGVVALLRMQEWSEVLSFIEPFSAKTPLAIFSQNPENLLNFWESLEERDIHFNSPLTLPSCLLQLKTNGFFDQLCTKSQVSFPEKSMLNSSFTLSELFANRMIKYT